MRVPATALAIKPQERCPGWRMKLEKFLIEHCSPTLASLKAGNLVNISKYEIENASKSIEELNEKLNKKGVNVRIVKESNTRILVYVYRKDKLIDEWAKPGVKSFMEKRGYGDLSVDMAIDKLSDKLMKNEGFPHEIGMFLGYPLGDVIGFIANSGKNSKCTGCWKVYCDECNAKKKFAQFDKCKKVYKNLWNSGKGLMQLAVSA
ncbi:hypothetical protein HMPREF9089_00996 [Eubacterium brachy ATCC 33089]|nr:hypothetical protein HMPREF9089_00996 [Eubacterium brachy ATCC 33089]